MPPILDHRRFLASLSLLLGTCLSLSACGNPFARTGADSDGVLHAHQEGKAIPTSPGAPSLGQQPTMPVDPEVAGHGAVPLTLLYTSDIHSRVDPFPAGFYHRTYAGKGGFARIAAMTRRIRAQNPATLLLDSGDYLQGSPYYNFFGGEVETHALDRAGYDAVTIGNHEFDRGVPALRKVIGNYRGPVITTNVTFSPDMGQRYAVLRAGKLRVGLFALLTEVSGLVTAPNFQTASYYDPIKAARAAVEKLSKEADVIVCMSHIGIVPPWSDDDEPNPNHLSDERLAEKVPGIDVILSGHVHALVERPIVVRSGNHTTTIVADGYGGGYLGKLDLVVKDGSVVQANNNLIPLDASVERDPSVESVIMPYRSQMAKVLDRYLGQAQADFRRYGKDDLESSLNNLIADATLAGARSLDAAVDFGMSSSGTPRNYLLSGPVKVEDVYYALPFDNRIAIVEAPARTVVELMEATRRSADTRRHAVSNASYVWDPARKKASNILIGGKPLDMKRTYKVAVNDYMADGGSGFSMLPGLRRVQTEMLQRDALIRLIENTQVLFPQTGRIKLVGRP